MNSLILEKKAGFFTSLPFVIYELNGNVFYSSDFTDKISKGEVLKFNLPAGKFKYEGSLNKLDFPIQTKTIILPLPERLLLKKRYKIIFGNNPHRCTIFYKAGIILFDKAFKDAPLYIKYGVYFHELGHHFYTTEKYADLYSVKKLLDLGFNPSQIGRTNIYALKPESLERKEFIINKLTNNKS